jgi:hypothetical protein
MTKKSERFELMFSGKNNGRRTQPNPWPNTTCGLEGSPIASAKMAVPSLERTNFCMGVMDFNGRTELEAS